MSHWRNVTELPVKGVFVLAVPVYGSEHHPTKPKQFLGWDTWTQDVDCDWTEEQEIGWRVDDAAMFCDAPPAYTN